jgi:hypothetical protein
LANLRARSSFACPRHGGKPVRTRAGAYSCGEVGDAVEGALKAGELPIAKGVMIKSGKKLDDFLIVDAAPDTADEECCRRSSS